MSDTLTAAKRIPGSGGDVGVGVLPVLAVVLMAAGCASSSTFDNIPRVRLGGLPFPGLFTLYAQGDPQSLGRHRYRGFANIIALRDEQDRGILYTCRAGFVDIAHLRKAADWAAHLAHRVHATLEAGDKSMQFVAYEPSIYTVRFRRPGWWDTMDETTRHDMIQELSLRIGQRLSFLATTWHEIITWYGYKATAVISEKRSAFVYDDTTSHLLGIHVVDRALRDSDRTYDDAVTATLTRMLTQLQVVSKKQAREAVSAVKGKWWIDDRPLKRDLNIGLEGNRFTPWLVRDASFCRDAKPIILSLPTLDDVGGRAMNDFYSVEIAPRIRESASIFELLATRSRTIRPAEHFPVIMADIRRDMVTKYGADVDRPY